MVKEITPDNSIIILIVATSSGEVDWILPALKIFMEKNEDWRLVTVFGHKLVFDRFRETNPILYKRFSDISSMNIVPQEMELLSANIKPDKIKIILKDYNKDEFTPCKTLIQQQFPHAKVVSYPHSCHIYSNLEKDPMGTCDTPDAFSKHDIFLLGSENDIPFWSSHVDIKKIRAHGTPRYDDWWVDEFLEDPGLSETREFCRSQEADKVFFYVSRGEHPHYLSKSHYEYLVKSIAESVFSYDNSLLLIKPHPRQDISELFRLLSPYDTDRYLVSGLHLFQLAHISDVVISGWSSGILDSLAVGKPVIEFWKFGGNDPACRKDEKGNFTTIYRELGLAAPADTKEDLDNLLKSALEDPNASIWTNQKKAFKKYCRFEPDSSVKIASTIKDAVETIFSTNEGQVEVPEPALKIKPDESTYHEPPDQLIEIAIEYVNALVEAGLEKKAKKWLSFLYEQFPKKSIVLNNYSIFLFNEGNVEAAVELLVECLNLNPGFKEAILNLIQILLIAGRTEDALEIVMSHYLNTPNKENKKMFLDSLVEQLTEEQFLLVRERLAKMRE